MRKLLRRRCIPALASTTSPLQVGGLPGYPVTVPAHTTRLYQSGCLRRGLCHGVVFLDLQEAFYRIVRPLITGGSLTHEALARACQAVNLPPGVYHDLQKHLQQPALAHAAGASDWATLALEESLHDTWFRFPREPEVVATCIGSRPGDSLSDLVFSFLFARVLRHIRATLREAGYVTKLPWDAAMLNRLVLLDGPPSGEVELLDSTWMDDLSLLLQAPDAEAFLQRLTYGASTLVDSCLEHALLPNLGRGKTEALVHLRSRQARSVRRQLFADQGGALPLRCRLWPEAKLRVTAAYKHLGGLLHHQGHLLREVKARAAQAWTAFNQNKKKVFASPLVLLADKATLFDSLVATTLFYGSGTWPEPSVDCIQKLTGTLRSMACTNRVLSLVGLPSAETYLHIHRLRYLLSCMVLQTPELWALAHWEGVWLRTTASSVPWLWEQVDGGQSYPDWAAAWEAWKAEAIRCPGRWKARLRRAQHNALCRERWQAALLQHQGLHLRELQALGATVPMSLFGEEDSRECCALCHRVFPDYRAWSVHAFSTHGRTDEVRRLTTGSQCPSCLKHFASASAVKLGRHLKYSAACRSHLLATGRRNAPEPGIGSRKAPDDGLLLMPTLQAEGPHPRLEARFIDDEEERPSAEVLDCLAHLDYDGSLAQLGHAAFWDRIRVSFSCVCLQASRLRVTAICWRGFAYGCDAAAASSTAGLLRDAADWLCRTNLVSWLVPDPDTLRSTTDTFKHSSIYLSLLECHEARLPDTEAVKSG